MPGSRGSTDGDKMLLRMAVRSCFYAGIFILELRRDIGEMTGRREKARRKWGDRMSPLLKRGISEVH